MVSLECLLLHAIRLGYDICHFIHPLVGYENEGTMKAWTDYPVTELGDVSGQIAPVRECTVLSWNGDKYCDILVEGVKTNIKRGYIYSEPGRATEVPNVATEDLIKLHPSPTIYHAQELLMKFPHEVLKIEERQIRYDSEWYVVDESGTWFATFDSRIYAEAFVQTREIMQAMVTHILDLEKRLEEALLNKIPHYVVDPMYEAKLAPQIRGSRPVVKSRSPEERRQTIQSLRDKLVQEVQDVAAKAQYEASQVYPYRKGDL